MSANISHAVDLDRRRDPDDENYYPHREMDDHPGLFGSVFPQAQHDEPDRDRQQSRREVDQSAATGGVFAQDRSGVDGN
ncbi:hypothetical protein [Mycobacterium paragordonae]|uniref:hypothetical protein n=1 Tax=Mycobacterium paragordonae TaxID=1389713 RepID=UPI0013C467AC|nr:hypothetical protein [Mycobacterium paragordonae]